MDEISKLQKMIDECENIVFFGGLVFRQKVVLRILEVKMAFII